MKIAIVTNILPPYRVPLFNYLGKQRDVNLKVFLCAASEPNRHWNWPQNIQFDYEIVNSLKWSPTYGKTVYLNYNLISRIKRFKPHVVICGGMGVVAIISWIGAFLIGASFLLWGEGMSGADGWIGHIMSPVRRFLVRIADGIISSSQSAADLFCSYGANPEKITISLITLDTSKFAQQVDKCRAAREVNKKKFGFNGPLILYVGRLERYKGVDLLLATFEQLLKTLPLAELVIIGTGTQLDELRKQVSAGSESKVHFVGTKQPYELPLYYAIADLFALFSRSEPFGLVITEAVVAGLPVICSKYAGAAYDLVENGQNGFIIDPENIQTNAGLMNKILSEDSLCEGMGERSRIIAKKCTVEEAADSMLHAVRSAVDNSIKQ